MGNAGAIVSVGGAGQTPTGHAARDIAADPSRTDGNYFRDFW